MPIALYLTNFEELVFPPAPIFGTSEAGTGRSLKALDTFESIAAA